MLNRTSLFFCLFICFPTGALAQSSQPAAASDSARAPASPAPDTLNTHNTQRVWTNDDLGALPSNHLAAKPRLSARPKQPAIPLAPSAKPWEVQRYRNQIARLQMQVASLDPQIAELQTAIDGKPVDEPRKYTWSKIASYPDELAALRARREGLLDQISSLEDQARHAGIPPGALR